MLVFNRPEHTARVLGVIRRARPPELVVIADGPRPGKDGEEARCAQVRALFDDVGWPCRVTREFAPANMGCRRRVASGLTRLFEEHEEAIILEDDCVPDDSFFPFCEELLERYRREPRVMLVSGTNQAAALGGPPPSRSEDSYFFSRYMQIWGWATWRRVWLGHDPSMSAWPALRDSSWLRKYLGDFGASIFWKLWFESAFDGRFDSWATPFALSCWMRSGLAAIPARNLVSNIGFGGESTHCTASSPLADLPRRGLEFPLRHPPDLMPERAVDEWLERRLYSGGGHKRFRRLRRYLVKGLRARP